MPACSAPSVVTSLRDFYRTAPLVLPSNSKFHQFRCQLASGYFRVLLGSVRSVEDLREQLVRYAPLNVWESANQFLNPSSVGFNDYRGKRAGYQISNNLMLGDGVLAFDVDFHDRSFDEGKADALRILDYLHELGLKEERVTYTGRGFQIIVEKHDLHLPRGSP